MGNGEGPRIGRGHGRRQRGGPSGAPGGIVNGENGEGRRRGEMGKERRTRRGVER